MNQSVYAISPGLFLPAAPVDAASGATADLLKQLLDLQREHLEFVKAQQSAHDERTRWATFHGRWAGEFPDLPQTCKAVLPKVERAYMALLQEAADALNADGDDVLESEYTLAEYLDKYSVRIAQLGNILGPVNHMANVPLPPADAPAE